MSGHSKIEDLRRRIDQLDEEILRLVNERIERAKEVGALKSKSGDKAVYRPEREAQILHRLTEINSGPLRPAQLQTIFREVISIARAAESLPRVAVLGPAGTYSQAAVIKHFGREVEPVFGEDIEDVFRLVESREADHGVVPVENSTEGGISSTSGLPGDNGALRYRGGESQNQPFAGRSNARAGAGKDRSWA